MRDTSEKSAGAFRTIKEAADELDVPQHVLRFWETRFAQIRPVKRAGGRRYYRPDDVDLLKGIKRLLHGQGYTIKGAQRVLRERGLRFVQSVGRGEAEAAAPTLQETESGLEGGPHQDEGLAAHDRAALEEALRDLLECRAAITRLRLPPES
ncbi:MerR family transcriptional regulator [Methylobacterium sp. J-068]|uniref:MerR family transcriptional regulator n=1 Tax=Methylobacterium sp. J-068 TaxID=2836649 RepID=UPI001FBBF83B|nr:MerR family transcriptional regulator [Methylobacterium sp. J-068]MCJ2035194.1 MerR family transcriptional regulator [Methylobacterium sp. J-068]